MGQKVNPNGLRVGIIRNWGSHWFVDKKDFASNIKEDNEIRAFLKKKYYQAAISKIVIEKAANKIVISIFTARPGVLIGKQGAEIEVIKKSVAKLCKGKQISVNITEVKKPDADAQLVAESTCKRRNSNPPRLGRLPCTVDIY